MRTLLFRIAAILVVSIVCVVAIANVLAAVFLTQPDPLRMVGPMAGQISAIDAYYRERSASRGNRVPDVVDKGALRTDLTSALQKRLQDNGVEVPVTVHDTGDGTAQVATIQLDGREITIDFPAPGGPPADLWILLARWMGLILVGVIAVALVMAYRVTRPFVILENAIASVGPDGVLPPIPETGSGEVRETAAVINRLSARLRHAMESRMRLVAAAGHDLRTPMTRMRIRAEFLNDDDRPGWLDDLDELELIADSAIRLVREEASGGDEQAVALDTLVAETVAELAGQNLNVVLTQSTPATIRAGQWALKRALRNVLINAATHGGGGRVRLSADGEMATITVEDSGPGIPDHLIDKVFEPFFRAEPGRVQTMPGAGLGLAIAHEIIDRFGGSITIRNGEAGGLIQTIRFSLANDG